MIFSENEIKLIARSRMVGSRIRSMIFIAITIVICATIGIVISHFSEIYWLFFVCTFFGLIVAYPIFVLPAQRIEDEKVNALVEEWRKENEIKHS